MRYITKSSQYNHVIYSVLFSVWVLCAPAVTSAQVLTLDSVLKLVAENHPILKEYDSRVNAMNEYAEGARSWAAPMVGVGPFMMPYTNSNDIAGGGGSWMLTLEQDIPNPAKQKANARYLQSRAAVEMGSRAMQFNDLRSQAKLHYYRWFVAEKKLRVLYENEEIMALVLELARIRHPYNRGELANTYKAEGRLAEVVNEQLTIKGEIESLKSQLQALMGLSMSDSIMVDTTTKITFPYDVTVYDTTRLGEVRSDVQQIEAQIETLRLNRELRRVQAKPDFKVRLDHMEPVGGMPAQYSVMAMVSIPVAPWSSKTYRSEVRGMAFDIEAMERQKQAVLLRARGVLASLVSRIGRVERQMINYETAIIPALRKNYQTRMLAYEENAGELLGVIDAWEALNMAQMEYLEKMEEYLIMIVTYEKEVEK